MAFIDNIVSKAAKLVTLERLILVGLVVFLFFLNRCNNRKYQNELSANTETIDSLTLANQRWDSIHDADGQTIQVQTALVVKNQEAFRKYSDSMFNLTKRQERRIKEIIAHYSSVTNTGVDTVKIPYRDTTAMKKFSDSVEKQCADVIAFYRKNALEIPQDSVTGEPIGKPVKDSTAEFVFDATIFKDTLRINKISFPDSLEVRFVETKGGLFRRNAQGKVKIFSRRSVEVQVKHSNSKVSTSKMNSLIYKPDKKFKWLEKALLIGAGIFVGLKI
jgi:hypothetical protein